METSRRRFLFGRGREQAPPQEETKQKQPNDDTPASPERRKFIKDSAKAMAGAVVGAELLRANEAEAGLRADPMEMGPMPPELERHMDAFNTAYKETAREFGYLRGQRTIAEQDAAREKFLAAVGDSVEDALAKAMEYRNTTGYFRPLQVLEHRLTEMDCYGLYYAFLDKQGTYNPEGYRSSFEWQNNHYAVRASDFLPDSSKLSNVEIDPRLGQFDEDPKDSDQLKKVKERIQITTAIRPAWTDPKRQKQFKGILDNPTVRPQFEQSDCTLAEVYSMIKAAVRFREEHPTTRMPDEHIITALMNKREQFKKQEILGPETNAFIHFNYYQEGDPKFFDGDLLDDIGKATVDKGNRGESKVERIDGNDEGVTMKLFHALYKSRGATTVYYNTHGHPNNLGIASNIGRGISLNDIVKPLLWRLTETKDPATLGDLTIVVNACRSHDFARNVIDDLRRQYNEGYGEIITDTETKKKYHKETMGNIDFEKITLPTIIASTQEGSLSFKSVMEQPLKSNQKAIEREGKLTGEMLMRRIQPQSYHAADISIFSAQKRGKLLEIGMTEQEDLELRAA